MSEKIYRLHAEKNGFSCKNVSGRDRALMRAVCPDCKMEDVVSDEEFEKLSRYPFRPIVCAYMVPRLLVDLHCLCGAAGYGRLAFKRGSSAVWLDEFEKIDTDCLNGVMYYTLRGACLQGGELHVSIAAAKDCAAAIIRVEPINVPGEFSIYFVYGGMTGLITHSPYQFEYEENMCLNNCVRIAGSQARISLEDSLAALRFDGYAPRNDYKRYWAPFRADVKIPDFKKYINLRASGSFAAAAPEVMRSLESGRIVETDEAQNALACACLGNGGVMYATAGIGAHFDSTPFETLYAEAVENGARITSVLDIKTEDDYLTGCVNLAALSNYALFAGNVFLHGLVSWRYGYLGWRLAYGSLALGYFDRVRKHVMSHLEHSLITEGDDRGGICDMFEDGKPDRGMFYGMHETFLDQVHSYLKYTNDTSILPKLIPALEGNIEREIRRLKSGEEWLFENSLNTWISDSHWMILGQNTQASAYMYSFAKWAYELTGKQQYADLADNIKRDLKRVLWQKRKGVFAYGKDTRGNRLLHPEPELADVYHSAELGVTDEYETYQMLDWVEGNLRRETTPNGGKLIWSADWHPNQGDEYTHSTYELAMAEELNLALIYQHLGLAEEGYEIFKTIYHSIYGAPVTNEVDHDMDKYIAEGAPPIITDMAGGIPCQVYANGASRRNVEFGDTIGMLGRELGEGLFGIRPERNNGRIVLAPCLPAELPALSVNTKLLSYRYARTDKRLTLEFENHCRESRLDIRLRLPVCRVTRCTLDGQAADYKINSAFDGFDLCLSADKGTLEIEFERINVQKLPRLNFESGKPAVIELESERILSIKDPQGIAESANIANGKLYFTASREAGTGVIFLTVDTCGLTYIKPVKLELLPRKEVKVFEPLHKAFSAPYECDCIEMGSMFNASSPKQTLKLLADNMVPIDPQHCQVNSIYMRDHITARAVSNGVYTFTDERFRNKVNADGIALTDEGIPFRSQRDGNYMALTTLISRAFPEEVTVPVGKAGRALYLLVTGITFPMQSHVENLRITLVYDDGVREEHRLVNPYDIGDMWFTMWGRYHDTPANGFENLCGRHGALSSVGQDLTKSVETDVEAHIIMYRLRPLHTLHSIKFRTIALDCAYGLMGATVLK